VKSTKVSELTAKSVEELEEMVRQERAALYKARRDLVFRQMTDTQSLKVRRHNIARMLTLATQKKKEQAS
jgi:large subunit ribosomal protein L29